jgi:selenocysteine lyase/cysteine desulfurase
MISDNEKGIELDVQQLSVEDFKRKYPNGLYIVEPLSELQFLETEDEELNSEVNEAVVVSDSEMQAIEDYEILHDGRLEKGLEELANIENSGDEQLKHSMYYFNLKNRIERILKLKNPK